MLAEMRLDEASVATGLLHDVVEDTLVDLATIRTYFGDEITGLVDGLTKIAHISDLSFTSLRRFGSAPNLSSVWRVAVSE